MRNAVKTKSFKSRLINASLVVLSIAILLVTVEGLSYLVLKVSDEGYYRPDFKNSLGLRDPREPHQLRNKQVVLAIGDSFTHGLGVPYQNSYPAQLEANLQSVYSDVAVVNAGIPGLETNMALNLLKRVYDDYEPKLVILGFHSGDVVQNLQIVDDGINSTVMDDKNFKEIIRHSEEHLPKLFLLKEFLRQKTSTFALVNYLYKNYIIKYLPPPAEMTSLGAGNDFQATEYLLDKMHEFLSSRNTKLVILSIVPLVRFDAYPYNLLNERLEKYAQSRNVDFINPLKEFSKHSSSELWVSIRDGHYNAEGNRVISEAVMAYLIKHNLLADAHPIARRLE